MSEKSPYMTMYVRQFIQNVGKKSGWWVDNEPHRNYTESEINFFNNEFYPKSNIEDYKTRLYSRFIN